MGNREYWFANEFKAVVNSFPYAFRAQIACYESKGDLSPVMLKEIFHDSSENFEITRICMVNHAIVAGWQKLFFSYKSAAVAIARYTAENSQVT